MATGTTEHEFGSLMLRYTLIRSKRRTLSLEVKNGKILVRAPQAADIGQIETFYRHIADGLRLGWQGSGR